jgi:6,7-dimethyl-8-ribityllumazine synthase
MAVKENAMGDSRAAPSADGAKHAGGRIAFVQACWHRDIVDNCRVAFLEEMAQRGYPADQIDLYEVPGSFEIPLQAKLLARSGHYAAIVGAGLVVNGGIYRHEFVAEAVISGLMQVQLETEVPVLSAVLTPHNFHDHEDHRHFFREHFLVKGREVAAACAATLANVERVRQLAA